MKRYSFRKTGKPTTVHVSWLGDKLCADNVMYHMRQYGPCTFEGWDSRAHGRKTMNTATIKFTDCQNAQSALSVRHVKIENEDEEMVPAKLSWQLSAETSLL